MDNVSNKYKYNPCKLYFYFLILAMKAVISPNKPVYSIGASGGNQISIEKNTNYKIH